MGADQHVYHVPCLVHAVHIAALGHLLKAHTYKPVTSTKNVKLAS